MPTTLSDAASIAEVKILSQHYWENIPKDILSVNPINDKIRFKEKQATKEAAEKVADFWVKEIQKHFVGYFSIHIKVIDSPAFEKVYDNQD